VILLDLKLPLVDGLEVLRRVKRDARTKLIPIVVHLLARGPRRGGVRWPRGQQLHRQAVDFEKFSACTQTIGLYWLAMNEPPAVLHA
jgi:two-component system response regulator